jgi:HSP20 family molecular chaperone IbpA
LKAFPRQLNLRVSDPLRLFSKTLALPAEVDHASLKYTLKNGILEVVLKKKK